MNESISPPHKDFAIWARGLLDMMETYPVAAQWTKRVYWNGWLNLVVMEVEAPWELFRMPLTQEVFEDSSDDAIFHAVRRMVSDVASHKGDTNPLVSL